MKKKKKTKKKKRFRIVFRKVGYCLENPAYIALSNWENETLSPEQVALVLFVRGLSGRGPAPNRTRPLARLSWTKYRPDREIR